jgi:hypothetical protein
MITPLPSDNLDWQKSSYCGNSTCVEVALAETYVAVRDSKNITQSALVYSREEWTAFLAGAKDGEFDLPVQ